MRHLPRKIRPLVPLFAGSLLLAGPVAAFSVPATAVAASGCAPYSTLECSAVVPTDPTSLSFVGDAGGLADKAGVGTGFTAVQPNTAGDQYLPANLSVDTAAKRLVVTATQGIQYQAPPASANTNNLRNGLAVGLRSAGARSTLTTTVVSPFVATGSSASEQAGLWFGPDQDNYVKIVVQTGGNGVDGVQLTKEVNATVAKTDQIPNGSLSGKVVKGDTVALQLVADAGSGTVSGSYQVNGGASVALGGLSAPASFFDGSTLASQSSGATGFGGIFATTRNNTTPIDYSFSSFGAKAAKLPAAPTGLTATAHPGSVDLDWSDNAAADSVSGYSVFRSDSTAALATGLTSSAYTDATVTNGELYRYTVTATNDTGTSPASASAGAEPDVATAPAFSSPARVNFTAQAGDTVAGYQADSGQPYANVRGYGWVVPGSHDPLSLEGNGRDRDDPTVTDERQDSLLHMQGNDVTKFANVASPGSWELAVPNGSYDVVVGVGDPSPGADPTVHTINVEGTNVVDHFAVASGATGAARFTTGTGRGIAVADGRLTVDADGGTNTKIDFITVTAAAPPADTTAPAVPTGLAATAGDGRVSLGWTANTEPDLAGYDLYRSSGSAPVDATGTPVNGSTPIAAGTSSYTDATVTNGTTYHYELVAVDRAGNASAPSAATDATPKAAADTTAPAAPKGLTATAGDGQVVLSWTANTEPDLAGYNLYRGTTAGGEATAPVNGALITATSYTDTQPVNGTRYFYVLRAVDNAPAPNTGDPSNEVVATPAAAKDTTPPAAPKGLAAAAGDASAALSWTANTEPDLAGYNLYRASGSAPVDVTGTPVNGGTPIAKTATTYTDTKLTNGTAYTYELVALDTAANASASSAAASATPKAAGGGTASCSADQYVGEYFDNTTFTGAPVATRCDDAINNDYGNGGPDVPGIGPDQFSIRWTQQPTLTAGNYTFTSTSDDGMTVAVDGTTVVDNSGLHGPATRRGAVDLAAGQHTIVVSYVENYGGALARFSYVPTPGSGTGTCTAGQFSAEYFANTTLSGTPVTTRCEDAVDNDYGNGHPDGVAVGDDNFSARWTQVKAFSAGDVTFRVNSDDGSRVYVDGDLVIDNFTDHAAAAKSATVPLTADTHTVVVEYYERTGGAVIQFSETNAAGATTCSGTQYRAEYYGTNDLTGPVRATRCDDAIANDYGSGGPDVPGVGPDNFSVRWTQVHAFAADGRYTFSSTADDGMVVTLDGTTVLDNGGSHGSQTRTAGVDITAGAHTIVVEYREFGGQAEAAFSYSPAMASACSASQYTAQYFANTTFSGTPVATRCEDAIDNDYGNGGPDVAGIGADNFSVRWTQTRNFTAGDYTFTSTSDDGMVVGLDGTQILDNGGLHGAQTRTVTRTLTAASHTVVVSYFEQTGGAVAKFSATAVTPQAPAAPTGLTASAADSAVTLNWTASSGATGYRIYRSTTGTPATTGTPINTDPVAGTTYTDTTVGNGTTYHYVVTALNGAAESGASNEATATPTAPVVHAKINFQPALAPTVAGYTVEDGQPYSGATGLGWVRQDSLSGTHTALDLNSTGAHNATSDGNARDRNRPGIDQLLDTFIHMQYGDVGGTNNVNGNPVPGAFEYAVPNGTYTVTVSVGDQAGATTPTCASPCYDSLHTINVEGTTAIDRFRATAATEYRRATVTVPVRDGRLTIDATGGTNTKLNWVTIDSAVPDTTPPVAPRNVTATAGNGTVGVGWSANTEPDLAGYQVYRSTSGTPATTGAPLNGALVTGTGFADTTAVNGTTYTYVVTAVDTTGNASSASAPATATPVATAAGDVHLKVNFSDADTTPPSGYLLDDGEAYGPRSGAGQGSGNTYGWVQLGTQTPVSLVGNGRNRNTGSPSANQPDLRLATFIHMQLPANATSGVKTPGTWELSVPNGTYEVTVAAGEAGTAIDSDNWLNIEDQNAVAAFTPTATTMFATATRDVVVTDGRLTVSPQGGTNTKIDYVTVDTITGTANRPSVNPQLVPNLATDVDLTSAIVEDLRLKAGPVDENSLKAGAVTLTRVDNGSTVASNINTSGGGDTINIGPVSPLAGGTLYRVTVTDRVTDSSGNTFLPFSSVFTTRASGTTSSNGGGIPGVGFDKVPSGAVSGFYTNMTKGPDGKLYAATIDGHIYRYTINADGTLSSPQTIDTVLTHAKTAGYTGNRANRSIIGLAFDPASTAADLKLWVTDNPAFLGDLNLPDFSDNLSYLTGPDLGTYHEVLTGLPRSVKDHETNSIAFGPDGALYFTQGASNAMGAPDPTWKNRPEHLLTAAVLRLDTARLPSGLPLDVTTVDAGGPYDPFTANAPLTVYASGIRNAYDLVWHSNGHLYTPTNGSAAGGNTPATPNPLPADCTTHRLDGTAYTGPTVPGITNNGQSQTDFVYDVARGRYYGHPNPTRCEWVLDNGNPTTGTDPFQVDAYPAGVVADRNYDLAHTYDAGLHASADGAVEYRGNAFGGKLNGNLLVVRYSSGLDIESFQVAAGGALSNRTYGITGLSGLDQPLALFEDTAKGNLYVSETGNNSQRLTLLRPQGGSTGTPTASATGRLVFNDVAGGAASPSKTVAVKNTGGAPLTVRSLTVADDIADRTYGGHGAQFGLVNAPTLPATVAPGATLNVGVAFNPTAPGPQGGVLQVGTDDPSSPTTSVTLRGLGTKGIGGANEPSLQWILDTEQIRLASGTTDPTSNTMPSTPTAIGDEVGVPAFVKADADSPVTVTSLAVFGPQGPSGDPNVVHVRAYDATTPTTTLQGILDAPNSSYQALDPAVTNVTDFDPAGTFGLSWSWPGLGHTSYQRDDLNTWESNTGARHKVRVYPLTTSTGDPVANSYVVAPEDVSAPGVDYQDAVLILRNVKPAPVTQTANRAVLAVSNLDGVPYSDRLAFSRIQSPRTDKLPNDPQLVHDTATERISNTGTDPMTVTGLPITGPWKLASTTTLPATVAPGGSLDVTLTFTATGGGLNTGSLTVQTDAGSGTSKVVELAGFWQSVSEGGQEPDVNQIARTMGWKIAIPDNLDKNGAVVAQGDEVLSPYWRRADTAAPVNVTQISGYHTWNNGATFRFVNTTGGVLTTFGMNPDSAQSLLPWAPGSRTVVAGKSYSPTVTTFGFSVDSESSDDTRNNATPDHNNGCTDPCGHHVLFFPVKDRAGAVVPNAYLMGMDYSGINYDYNDNMYLVTNVTPDRPQPPTGVTAVAGDHRVTVSWTVDSGVAGYDVFRGTSASVDTTGTPLNGSTRITGGSWVDTTATNGTTYYYVVRAASPSGSTSAPSAAVAATPVSPGQLTAHLNFQPDASTVPSGYTRDTGQGFTAARGFGWVRPGTSTPVDMTPSTRDRGAPADGRLATVILMQGNGAANQPNVGAWEYALPSGTYAVTLAVGDSGYVDSTDVVNVEGTRAVDGFVPTTATPFRTVTVTVPVTDGKLTIDATGGTNTKLDYVDIAAARDTTPPAAVTGLSAAGSASGIALDWSDNTDSDLYGYDVSRSATATGTYTLLTTAPVTASAYTDASAPAGTTSYYQVTAVDSSGNESAPAGVSAARPGSTATTVSRLNAGGTAQTVGTTTWAACTTTANCSGRVRGGGFSYSENDTVTGIPTGLNNAIFQSEWTGGASGGTPVAVGKSAFGFDFPVTNGSYTVTLYFAELNKTAAGQRVFDVTLNGQTVLNRFDVFAAAGGTDKAVWRSFPVTVTSGQVSLDFIREVENAKVSAIAIAPAN